MASLLSSQVKEKRRILEGTYGGMVSLAQLTRELGLKDTRAAKAWADRNGLLGVQVGRWIKFETSEVAKVIVNLRGMC